MCAESIVVFRNVSFSFAPDRQLFRGISLAFQEGGFYLVRGPSGAGKSTLLRLINRLEEPSSGEILFRSLPLAAYPPPVLRRSILFMQQTPTVIQGSVRDNLLLPFSFKNNRDLPRPRDEVLFARLKIFFPEKIRLEDAAGTLSVGQLQRLCFVRGLLLAPEILLLDEPTSALDDRSGRIVEEETERLCREEGLTVIMASHSSFKPRAVAPVVLNLLNGGFETSQ